MLMDTNSKLGRIDLLVLDELGYMDMTKDSANLFFQLVSKRYERGSIILNTNRPFEEWGSLQRIILSQLRF